MMYIFQRSFTMAILILALLILVLPGSAPVSAIHVTGAKYMNSIPPGGSDILKMTVGIGADEDPTDVNIDVLGFGQTKDLVYSTLELRLMISAHIQPGNLSHLTQTTFILNPEHKKM